MTSNRVTASNTTIRLTPDRVRVIAAQDYSSKCEVTTQISRILSDAYRRPNPDEWDLRMRHREALGPTGLSPHVALIYQFQRPGERVETANAEFDFWLFLVPGGIEWDAIDELPVHVIAVPVSRHNDRHIYIETFAAVHKTWAETTAAENLALARMTPAEAARRANTLAQGAGVAS